MIFGVICLDISRPQEVMSMSSIKCNNCGLANFSDAIECKRCGNVISRPKKKQRPPLRFTFYSLVIFGAVGVILYYALGGFEDSLSEVNRMEANRMAANVKINPAGLSQSQNERQSAGQYGTAVNNSNSLNEAQKRNEEIKKAIQNAQGSR